MINNLSLGFEALWRKILPPDFKKLVYFFFTHPLILKAYAQYGQNLCKVAAEKTKNKQDL